MDNVIFASDFEQENEINKYSEDNYLNPGVYSRTDQTENNFVSYSNGKLITNDNSSSSTEAYIGLGMIYSGVVSGTMKYTPVNTDKNINGGWSMVQFYGYVGDKYQTLFAIRTNDSKAMDFIFTSETIKDSSNKTVYTYRAETPFTYEANKEYEINWEYDFENGKITVSIDGNFLIKNYEVPLGSRPTFLSGLGFITAGDDTKRGAKIDDFAVAVSSDLALEETKTYFNVLINLDFTSYDLENDYKLLAETMTTYKNNTLLAIEAAEANEDVVSLFTTYFRNINNIFKKDQEIKEDAVSYLNESYLKYKDDYVYFENDLYSLYIQNVSLINDATSLSDIDTYKNIIEDEFIVDHENDEYIRNDMISRFNQALSGVSQSISEIDGITPEEIADSETRLGAVSAEYIGEDGTLVLCDMKEIDDILEEAVSKLDDIFELYNASIAELTETYNTLLEEEKEAKKEYMDTPIFDERIADITLLSADDYEDKASLKDAYDAKLALIDFYVEWYEDYLIHREEIAQYILVEREKVLDKGSNFGPFVNNLTEQRRNIFNTLATIDYSLESYEEQVENFIESSKAVIDVIIANYRAQTEAVITFKATEESENYVEQYSVVKGSTITPSETIPTLDGFVFKEWNFDFSQAVSENTTIYALWYDTYGDSIDKTESIDFRTLTKSDKGVTVTSNFKTAETFTVKDSDGNDFVFGVSSSASNMQVSTSNGLKVQKEGDYTYFTTNYISTMTLSFKSGDNRTVHIYFGNILIASITKNKDVGTTAEFTIDATGTIGTEFFSKSDSCSIKITNAPAGMYKCVNGGGYTMNFVSFEIHEESIAPTIASIDATVTNVEASISISDVKLTDIEGNIISITSSEYNVEVRDSNNQIINDYSQGLTPDTYKVIISYGQYTKIEKTITIQA